MGPMEKQMVEKHLLCMPQKSQGGEKSEILATLDICRGGAILATPDIFDIFAEKSARSWNLQVESWKLSL